MFDAVMAGSAAPLRSTIIAPDALSRHGLRLRGSVLVGHSSTADFPALRMHALSWADIDFAALDCECVILAERPPNQITRTLLARAASAHVRLFFAEGEGVRPMQLADLFHRDAADWSSAQACIANKRVLITGAGGSIGSEIARKAAEIAPARLALLDASEFNLFRIGQELPDTELILADVRDRDAMRRWFARERPQLVIHTAALKQVPLVQAFASEGVLTNVLGLRNVAEAAQAHNSDLIFLSTDKAVAPSSVMGASKRLGELYCQALDREGPSRAIPVRLGNVLGSAGSVAPTFEAQLAAGLPLTVTDPEVTRFFISIPFVACSILRAAAAGLDARQRGASLIVDMGPPLPVVELAHDIIRLRGLIPGVDAKIKFTGLRPGEKLHEELVGADEWLGGCPAPDLQAALSAPRDLDDLQDTMDHLVRLARAGSEALLVRTLFDAIAPPAAAARRAVM